MYTALKETEQRATDLLPYWKLPFASLFDERQRKAEDAVRVIRKTTEELIDRCKAIVEEEDAAGSGSGSAEDYVDEQDPSILRFLIQARDEVSSTQLRDDLLSMLVAGHETTASVLTWTIYLLLQNPECLRVAREEVDSILGQRKVPQYSDLADMPYTLRCIAEHEALPPPPSSSSAPWRTTGYPEASSCPRARTSSSRCTTCTQPGVWEDRGLQAGEVQTGRPPTSRTRTGTFLSAGSGKCIGDSLRSWAHVALVVLLREMKSTWCQTRRSRHNGAAIHTKDGLFVTARRRGGGAVADLEEEQVVQNAAPE